MKCLTLFILVQRGPNCHDKSTCSERQQWDKPRNTQTHTHRKVPTRCECVATEAVFDNVGLPRPGSGIQHCTRTFFQYHDLTEKRTGQKPAGLVSPMVRMAHHWLRFQVEVVSLLGWVPATCHKIRLPTLSHHKLHLRQTQTLKVS